MKITKCRFIISSLLTLMLVSGCKYSRDIEEKEVVGTWGMEDLERMKLMPNQNEVVPYLKIDSQKTFEGYFAKGLPSDDLGFGIYQASGTWLLCKGSKSRPKSDDTDWSLVFHIRQRDGIDVTPYDIDVELALFKNFMIDVWDGPDTEISYRRKK